MAGNSGPHPTREKDVEAMSDAKSLGEALPQEMARVRDELLPMYDAIPTGVFAATLMRQDLDRAAKAMAEGDTVEMMRVYQSLKDYTA
jgi:hypothetical protein